jgi:hypothetical protein
MFGSLRDVRVAAQFLAISYPAEGQLGRDVNRPSLHMLIQPWKLQLFCTLRPWRRNSNGHLIRANILLSIVSILIGVIKLPHASRLMMCWCGQFSAVLGPLGNRFSCQLYLSTGFAMWQLFAYGTRCLSNKIAR